MYLLKIVNEPRSDMPHRVLGDTASREHIFAWNDTHQAYCYQPVSQSESDDIIATNWMNLRFPWRIAPVMTGVAPVVAGGPLAPVTAKIPPYVRPELYDAYPLPDLLMLCADCGFAPEGDVSDDVNLKKQLHRYYEGRAWAIEENRRLKDRLKELEALPVPPPLPPAPVAQPSPVAPPPITMPSPVLAAPRLKRDMSAAHAARSAKAAERRRIAELTGPRPGMARAAVMEV